MKKNTLRLLLILLGSVVATFVFIYLFVFAGGWKLFESGDVILIEIGASVVIGLLFGALLAGMDSMVRDYDKKIAELEKRVEELEDKR